MNFLIDTFAPVFSSLGLLCFVLGLIHAVLVNLLIKTGVLGKTLCEDYSQIEEKFIAGFPIESLRPRLFNATGIQRSFFILFIGFLLFGVFHALRFFQYPAGLFRSYSFSGDYFSHVVLFLGLAWISYIFTGIKILMVSREEEGRRYYNLSRMITISLGICILIIVPSFGTHLWGVFRVFRIAIKHGIGFAIEQTGKAFLEGLPLASVIPLSILIIAFSVIRRRFVRQYKRLEVKRRRREAEQRAAEQQRKQEERQRREWTAATAVQNAIDDNKLRLEKLGIPTTELVERIERERKFTKPTPERVEEIANERIAAHRRAEEGEKRRKIEKKKGKHDIEAEVMEHADKLTREAEKRRIKEKREKND